MDDVGIKHYSDGMIINVYRAYYSLGESAKLARAREAVCGRARSGARALCSEHGMAASCSRVGPAAPSPASHPTRIPAKASRSSSASS